MVEIKINYDTNREGLEIYNMLETELNNPTASGAGRTLIDFPGSLIGIHAMYKRKDTREWVFKKYLLVWTREDQREWNHSFHGIFNVYMGLNKIKQIIEEEKQKHP